MTMKCPNCGSDQLRAHVMLAYDLPLAARDGAIKVGGVKISKLDLREAWEKLEQRPIWCTACHGQYFWDVRGHELVETDTW